MTRRAAALGLLLVVSAFFGGGRVGAQTPTPTTTAAAPVDEGDVFAGPQLGEFPDNRYLYYSGDGTAKVDVGAGSIPHIPCLPGLPCIPDAAQDLAKAIADAATPDAKVDTGVPTAKTADGTVAGWSWAHIQDGATILRNVVDWALSFEWLRQLGPAVERVTGVVNQVLLGPFRLREVVALITGVTLGLRLFLNRRFGQFLADAGVSLLLTTAAFLLIANPVGYFNAVADVAASAAQLPFRFIVPDDPNGGRHAAEEALKEVQTEVPWEIVNFGHGLTGPCEDAGKAILANGPYSSTSPKPAKVMSAAGCKDEAKTVSETDSARVAHVAWTGLFILLTTPAIVAILWSFLRAGWSFAWHMARGVWDLLVGSTPWAHSVAAKWVHGVADDVISMVVPAWLLGVMLLVDQLIIGTLDPVPVAGSVGVRLVFVAAANAAIFWKRRRIVNRVAATLSGGANRISTRVLRADNVNARRNTDAQRAEHARDYMPGHKLVTVPTVAASLAVTQAAANVSKKAKTAKTVGAAVAGGPVAAATTMAAGAARAKTDTAIGVRMTAAQTTEAAARAKAKADEWKAGRDARRGVGFAPLGDKVEGPPKPPSDDEVLTPGSEWAA